MINLKNSTMKQFCFLLIGCLPLIVSAQKSNAPVSAAITKVTIFTSGAQVEHTKQVSLSAGKQVVIFEKLTDFLDPNSIQLKSSTNATILSVRTRKNFDDLAIAKQDVDALNEKRKKLEAEEQLKRDEYLVLLNDEQLLMKNNDLGSKAETVKMAELKEASTFFHSKLTEINTRKSQLEQEIEEVVRKINTIEQEINTRRSLPVKNYTEIEVELDVISTGSIDFTFSYITPNASWKPYYDLRSAGVGSPVRLEAKGLVTQNTGMDWNNVNLILSTNDPYDNTQEALIEPWYVDYYTPAPYKRIAPRPAPEYDYSGELIHGEVLDAVTGDPLAFAKIQMGNDANNIVSTDINGKFSFTVPRNESSYTVSYLGYNSEYITIDAPYTKTLLFPQDVAMETLPANPFGNSGNGNGGGLGAGSINYAFGEDNGPGLDKDSGYFNRKVYADKIQDESLSTNTTMKAQNMTITQKDLRMEYQITVPFTIPSDNADHRVAIATYDMDANYEYHSVPKLDPSVYLVAQVTGWEKLNLLNGESNLYFDGTFIGKSYIDANSVKDTLSFSLGKDRKIVVERKRSEEKSKTRLIGSRYRYEVTWDFTIRNNGGAAIPFILKDHFPVSTNDDIKVKQGLYEGAMLDEKTGILTWRTSLNKGETKQFSFSYSVEYDEGAAVYLE